MKNQMNKKSATEPRFKLNLCKVQMLLLINACHDSCQPIDSLRLMLEKSIEEDEAECSHAVVVAGSWPRAGPSSWPSHARGGVGFCEGGPAETSA